MTVDENQWLKYVKEVFDNGKGEVKWVIDEIPVTFSGYFSKPQDDNELNPQAIIGLLTLFSEEKADSLSMQRHMKTAVKKQ